jgi:hypothetical protein
MFIEIITKTGEFFLVNTDNILYFKIIDKENVEVHLLSRNKIIRITRKEYLVLRNSFRVFSRAKPKTVAAKK